jgi:general L-amino acid transport system permease protein
VLWLLSPLVITVLLYGVAGSELLPRVRTDLWQGLLLTIILSVTGILASFPLGLLLALGRRSNLPILKLLSTFYIEVIRGVPLITVLFMAQVMAPLFLKQDIDTVVRAIVGITLFSAAYLAENIRGGLQAIPRGQIEAAQALGFSPLLVTSLIILPQAIRIVIPAIVGQFISLFKDTTLVSIITLIDLLGIAKTALAQSHEFQFHKTEVYLFLAAIYFVFSYLMSSAARRIESATSRMGGTRQL